MSAKWLEGGPVADAVLHEVRRRTAKLSREGVVPGLGTILVGDDGPSASYVRKKHETCERLGMKSFHIPLPAGASQQDLLAAVNTFNDDPAVHAFLIQHPVPRGLDYNAALLAMNPLKDADGLHPINLGRLVLQEPGPVPCTPAGIQAMLQHYGIDPAGKEVVILGRGPTLGRPLSLLLSAKARGADAAVTVIHSGISDLQLFTHRADILIAAVGVPGLVKAPMVKRGATVVSGGITWKGKKLIPDVDEGVAEVAGWLTPRLGGVGPTTVAMLMRNTVQAAETIENRAPDRIHPPL